MRLPGSHNIVIASLAAENYGTTSAATSASSLLTPLPSIHVGLLVGIGGGIARPDMWFQTKKIPPKVEVEEGRYLYDPVPMGDVELAYIPLNTF